QLELLEPAAPSGTTRAAGQVLVPRDPQYAVISDLDDTVLHSQATSLWQMARLTLLHNAHTRLPFDGVAGFYQPSSGAATARPSTRCSTSPTAPGTCTTCWRTSWTCTASRAGRCCC